MCAHILHTQEIGMRTLVFFELVIAIGFVTAQQPALAANCKYWRLGGSYIHIVNSKTSDLLGDGWGVVGEYSFTHALDPEEQIDGGDVSIAVSYRRFDNTTPEAYNTVDYTSFALKWRGGPGASPSRDGLYAGVGVAAALLRIQPNPINFGPHYGVTKFEWSALGGGNFAGRLYVELSYNSIPQIGDLTFQQFTVTIGGRL
jgi:hypothetical protein